MIRSISPVSTRDVAAHYDELDPFYRAIWGDHVHHGLWDSGSETPQEAVLALVHAVAHAVDIKPGNRICDIGCGYGATAYELADHFGARVVGITLSEVQARHAARRQDGRRGRGSTRFLVGDWLSAPMEATAFDAAIAIESLSHMSDLEAALRKAFAVLRPGGCFAACVWLSSDRPTTAQRRLLLEPICREGRLQGLPQLSEIEGLLSTAGFEQVLARDLSDRVRRTWSVCARRVISGLLTRPDYRRYIRDASNSNRVFARTVARIWTAYRFGAMRYALVSARRPGDLSGSDFDGVADRQRGTGGHQRHTHGAAEEGGNGRYGGESKHGR